GFIVRLRLQEATTERRSFELLLHREPERRGPAGSGGGREEAFVLVIRRRSGRTGVRHLGSPILVIEFRSVEPCTLALSFALDHRSPHSPSLTRLTLHH